MKADGLLWLRENVESIFNWYTMLFSTKQSIRPDEISLFIQALELSWLKFCLQPFLSGACSAFFC